MLESTAALGQALLSGTWKLFAITVPGFTFTFGQMWLGVAICTLSIVILRALLGAGGRSGGTSSRSGSTRNPKISNERKNDEF